MISLQSRIWKIESNDLSLPSLSEIFNDSPIFPILQTPMDYIGVHC